MPGNKSNFQPKDARAVSILYSDEDEDDISELFPHERPKRMMTGTQALVEFLKTTSPEEFQRNSSGSSNTPSEHKSMNNLFAKIRRGPKKQQQQQQQQQQTSPPFPTASSSSMSTRSTASLPVHHYHHQNNTSSFSDSSASTITATNGNRWMHSTTGSELSNNTIHRKNYIEIVPQSNPVSASARNPRSPSYDTTSVQPFVLRNNNNTTANSINNSSTSPTHAGQNGSGGEPILPNKKRESSLYSGSLRYSVSVRSQLSTATSSNNNNILYNTNHTHQRRQLVRDSQSSGTSGNNQRIESKATEDYLIAADGLDTIEAALLQRLERIKLANVDVPSEQVAAGLVAEHIRALGITHDLEYQHHQHSEKRKVRHMQVQTETSYGVNGKENGQSSKGADVKASTIATASKNTATSATPNDFDELNAELRARRAEAALENALDNFEVISGLAYKKLRELWEEKMRWENACMELRDRLLMMEQQQQQQRRMLKQTHQQQQQTVDVSEHLHNEYFLEKNEELEEEEDGLGLSEFPCDEEENS